MQSSSVDSNGLRTTTRVSRGCAAITLEHNGTDFDLFRLLRLIVTGVFASPCRTLPIGQSALWKHNETGKCFRQAPAPASLTATLTFSGNFHGNPGPTIPHNSPKWDLLNLLPRGGLPCLVVRL